MTTGGRVDIGTRHASAFQTQNAKDFKAFLEEQAKAQRGGNLPGNAAPLMVGPGDGSGNPPAKDGAAGTPETPPAKQDTPMAGTHPKTPAPPAKPPAPTTFAAMDDAGKTLQKLGVKEADLGAFARGEKIDIVKTDAGIRTKTYLQFKDGKLTFGVTSIINPDAGKPSLATARVFNSFAKQTDALARELGAKTLRLEGKLAVPDVQQFLEGQGFKVDPADPTVHVRETKLGGGGTPPKGGTPPTGTPPSGGTPPAGGTPPTGGTPSTGGTPPTGGTGASGTQGTFRHVFNPRDPDPTQHRLELKRVDGKWFEVRGKKGERLVPATGNYHYAIQDGRLFVSRYGHPEAAKGGRVAGAGDISFGKDGVVERWDNGSGSYRPAAEFAKRAGEQIGLPTDGDKFRPAGQEPGKKVQLPVIHDTPAPRGGSAQGAPPQGGAPLNGGNGGQTTPPPVSPPPAKTADVAKGRATVEHVPGATDPKTVKVKTINLADYPPDRPGKVTSFFKDRPVMSALTKQLASQGAQHLKGGMLDMVEKHFSGSLNDATAEFRANFPEVGTLMQNAGVKEKREAFYAAVRKLKMPNNAKIGAMVMIALAAPEKDRAKLIEAVERRAASMGGQPQVIKEFIRSRDAYFDAVQDVMEEVAKHWEPLPGIAADLGRRASVLQGASKDLYDAFWTIIGPASLHPITYYETFDIYTVAGTFERLGGRMQAFANEVAGRSDSYQQIFNTLNDEMMRASDELDKTRHLLGGKED